MYGDINNGGEFSLQDDGYNKFYVIPDSIYVNKQYKDWVANNMNDSFNIGSASYALTNVSKYGDTISIRKLPNKISGVNVGEEVSNFTVFNPLNGANYIYHQTNGPYLLLDFWGTWCGPCIKAIPELRSLDAYCKKQYNKLSVF